LRVDIETKQSPRLSGWHVRKALQWIPPTDLAAVGAIRIIEEEPDLPTYRAEPPYLRGFLCNGRYFRKSPSETAQIVLYTRDLFLGIPWLFKPTPMATLRFAFTLAHEVGHHIIATRGYIYKPHEKYKPWSKAKFDPYEEKMADSYASDVIKKMSESRLYQLGRVLGRIHSRALFEIAVWQHWAGNYEKAARLHFQAYMVDSENVDAGQSYTHDIKMVAREKDQHLTSPKSIPRCVS